MSEYLQIDTKTWNKDSFHLFDYDSKNLASKKFKVKTEGTITKNSINDIHMIEDLAPGPNRQRTENSQELGIIPIVDFYYENSQHIFYFPNSLILIYILK